MRAGNYWYELTDGFWGQLVLTQIPHLYAEDLLPKQESRHLDCMKHFVGMLEYLTSWRWGAVGTIHVPAREGRTGAVFLAASLPLILNDAGSVEHLSTYAQDAPIFATEQDAFKYLLAFAKHDLQMRGFRSDRLYAFMEKQKANYLLRQRVVDCKDDHEYDRWRQHWIEYNRPKARAMRWGEKQQQVLDIVTRELQCEDEEVKKQSRRQLYIDGPPGSGKSAVLLECALIAARAGQRVLIVCPTGALVYSFKAQLPDEAGVENIAVDTIQGVLKYKRPGPDTDHKSNAWAPPSALRRIELILIDEASQYDDREFERFYNAWKEQPHRPMVVIVADFQQLQPIGAETSRHLAYHFCMTQETVKLDTVYRSNDAEHLVFLNRIRSTQPDRKTLADYFAERRWPKQDHPHSLDKCVARGMSIAEMSEKPFTWLTSTNAGASEVCEAALRLLKITPQELAQGCPCDFTAKSSLRIVAKPGIMIRLTRNLDKKNGFVNGALATIVEALDGNRCFIAKLDSTKNYVLVHPLREMDQKRSVMTEFLPCIYGYATTIRRAQGASLDQGCLYFDQFKHAGRGYGYVGASRFKSRDGCYLYGRIRRTDFLPVGKPREDEVIERGMESESTDEEDGPQHSWANPLAGRMRGCDDADVSSDGEESVDEYDKVNPTDLEHPDIDFDLLEQGGPNIHQEIQEYGQANPTYLQQDMDFAPVAPARGVDDSADEENYEYAAPLNRGNDIDFC